MNPSSRLKTTVYFLFFAWTVALCLPETGNAEDLLHTRTYLGVEGTYTGINGDGIFSGSLYSRVDSPYEINLIPTLPANLGFAVFAGQREEAYAVELGYWRSNHTSAFGPVPSLGISSSYKDAAVYNCVSVGFKRYFFTDSDLQPFLNLGVSFPWVEVSNSAEDVQGTVGSSTYSGLGTDLGIGVEWYLDSHFSLTGSLMQRWASFNQFKGPSDSQSRSLSLSGSSLSNDGSGLNVMIGATAGFY